MRFSSRRSSVGSLSALPALPTLPGSPDSRLRAVAEPLPARDTLPTRTTSTASSNWGRRRWRSFSTRLAHSQASGSGVGLPAAPIPLLPASPPAAGMLPASSHCSQVPTFWLKKTRRLGLRLRDCRKRSPAAAERKPSHLPCTSGLEGV